MWGGGKKIDKVYEQTIGQERSLRVNMRRVEEQRQYET